MDYKPKHVVIEEHSSGQRIDNFLLKTLKGVPKSKIYTIIRKGEVRVNKKRIQPSYRLVLGDSVRVPPIRLGVPVTINYSSFLLEKLERSILFEDEDLLVINKPAGIAVHGGSGIVLGVIEAIRKLREKCKFLELVHRLDRDTSGCLLIAKSRRQLLDLHQKLLEKTVTKTYHAIVEGNWPKRLNKIDQPLKKNILQSGERIVRIDERGKPSLTTFNVLNKLHGYSLLEIHPHTGRTHQIRVHAAHAGYPILGDIKYGDKDKKIKRMFLHAYSIKFDCAKRGHKFIISAPYDTFFEETLKQYEEVS